MREVPSIFWNNVNGKRIWKRVDTCLGITESVCCTPVTSTLLLITYNQYKIKIVKNLAVIDSGWAECIRNLCSATFPKVPSKKLYPIIGMPRGQPQETMCYALRLSQYPAQATTDKVGTGPWSRAVFRLPNLQGKLGLASDISSLSHWNENEWGSCKGMRLKALMGLV